MNKKLVGYWIATALTALAIGAGGVTDLMKPPDMVQGMQHLGYPEYFLVILGTWKVLGALALVVPRLPLVKEWAYAGIAFDLTGASASHLFSGDPARNVITPILILAIVVASWWLRPASRRLPGTAKA